MPEDRDGLLQHFRDMRAELLAAIEGLSDDQVSDPSLDGWSVKDHLLHLAAWDELRAAEVARISAGHASAWRLSGEQEDAYNALIYARRRDLSARQARWELEASHRQLLDAIAAAAPRGLDASHYGEAALRSTHEAQHTVWIKRWRAERRI
ncbi:MAG: ClbS/DfsB family four-helix bundle protein [Dehalococcoidia bacterium]|nr:MAG: ClbS/DfsB family four-helix bundle protein [Dehalococcoidia bacterium]